MGRRLLALLCIGAVLTMGCWSRRELTEISFAGMMGIDWAEGKYEVTLNINSPKRAGGEETGGATRKEVWTVTGQGRSVDEALNRIDQILARSLTLAHVRSVIFGEELARRGIGPTLDFLLRSVEVRPTAWMGVTQGPAKELLKARPRQQTAPSEGPVGYHDVARLRSGYVPTQRLVDVTRILQEEGQDLALPFFRLGGEEAPRPAGAIEANEDAPQEIAFGGAGIFRGDKLVGWLSPVEARGGLWAERVEHGLVAARCRDEDREALFRVRKAGGEISVQMGPDGPRGRIYTKVFADLNELGCREFTVDGYNTAPLQRLLANQVSQEISMALEQARAAGSDFFGFGRQLYRDNPHLFKRKEAQWHKILAEMPVEIVVESRVPRLGQVTKRYLWSRELEEGEEKEEN